MVVPGAAFRAEEHVSHARLPRVGVRRLFARGRPSNRAVKRLDHRPRRRRVGRLPGEELVRSGAHGLQNQVGIGLGRDREDRQRGVPGAEPLDRGEPGCHVPADVDYAQVGDRGLSGPAFDDAYGYAPGAEQLRRAAAEVLVLRHDKSGELCHVYLSGSSKTGTADRESGLSPKGNACAGSTGPRLAT